MHYLTLFLIILPTFCSGVLFVGLGKTDLTPPIGTPSAGYEKRTVKGMEGVHDPLLAIAMVIDNGEQTLAFCSVDHLGFTYEMVQKIVSKVHEEVAHCQVYVGSSHTHSGGGAYLNIPVVGEMLAGKYNPLIADFYIDCAVQAIITAWKERQEAKIGIGYGQTSNLSKYRGLWPNDIQPLNDVTIIKVTSPKGIPIAVLFNYPMHPTVLGPENTQFSADFVGYARDYVNEMLNVQSLYFNGAQGDIIPNLSKGGDRFSHCDSIGKSLAETVVDIWKKTEVADTLAISTDKVSYSFTPRPTPLGLKLPIDSYDTEINLIVLNEEHVFVTIPGELSCLYDKKFKQKSNRPLSVLGLVNDAHGYIILPESWQHKTYESNLSFGGEFYGDTVEQIVNQLLEE